MDDGRPIFLQIADSIEAQILDGTMPEGSRVPSINELAAFHRINPATALKGVNLLVEAGVLHKRRGIGMFVTDGARAQLLASQRAAFAKDYIRPLLDRAQSLGINPVQLSDMIGKELDR